MPYHHDMADDNVDIKCPDCGTSVTFPRGQVPLRVSCPACRRHLASPDRPRPKSKLTLRQQGEQAEEAAPPPTDGVPKLQQGQQESFTELTSHQGDLYRTKHPPPHHWIAFGIFLVLGGAMAFIKYGNWMDSMIIGYMDLLAPYIILGLLIFVVLKAFKDSIMQGTLSLMIPGYAFYYLFSVCNDFYLRAVLAGLLPGFGEASFYKYRDWAFAALAKVNAFLATGGGEVFYD